MDRLSFRSFLNEGLRVVDKKWKPAQIEGKIVELNNTLDHSFRDRLRVIRKCYYDCPELQKEKHDWLRELSDKDFIKNVQDKVNKAIKKVQDKGTKEGVSHTVYFKKSKFIVILLVKLDYIRVNTIGAYDYYIKNSLKTSLNENAQILEVNE